MKKYKLINAINIDESIEFKADAFLLLLSTLISDYDIPDIINAYLFKNYYSYWDHLGFHYIDVSIYIDEDTQYKIIEIKSICRTTHWILNFEEIEDF